MLHRVWSISPILFEVGIRNSVCGCILGLWSFVYRFGLFVTLKQIINHTPFLKAMDCFAMIDYAREATK